MDRSEVELLLREVAAGGVDVAAALDRLSAGPMNGTADLGYARVDTHRGLRTGDPEVVYAAGKTVEQTLAILRALAGQPGSRPAVATRLSTDAMAAVRAEFPHAAVDEVAGSAAIGALPACHHAESEQTPTETPVVVQVEAARSGSLRAVIAATGLVTAAPGAELVLADGTAVGVVFQH